MMETDIRETAAKKEKKDDRAVETMQTALSAALQRGILRRAVLSKPLDRSILKTAATPFEKNGVLMVQLETFHTDGKAFHENLPAAEATDILTGRFLTDFLQLDIVTSAGSCVAMRSRKGNVHIKNGIAAETAERIAVPSHDRAKHYLLDNPGALPFLHLLGICGADGRVIERKGAKYRQINRFLELLSDVSERLPASGVLTVCDLCCGKSYLTFAVYWYLTAVLGREVRMYGVDRKPDVIAYCADAARALGWKDLTFLCGDVALFTPPERPDLVISLHACDTATDLVLSGAVRQEAGIILSTPCCHHELFAQMNCPSLRAVTAHSILKQKLCDAVTDSLRALRLEAAGYDVEALELIDPDDTPKNVMLRAVRRRGNDRAIREAAMAEYRRECTFFGVNPSLGKMLGDEPVSGA